MKTVQLQKAIITEITRKKPVRWFISRYEGRTALTEGSRVYLIDDEDLYINPNRLGEWSEDSLKVIIDAYKHKDLCDLYYKLSNLTQGYNLYVCDSFEVAINPSLFKYFEEFELKGTGKYDPVYVYEQGEFVGLVLPIRLSK